MRETSQDMYKEFEPKHSNIKIENSHERNDKKLEKANRTRILDKTNRRRRD